MDSPYFLLPSSLSPFLSFEVCGDGGGGGMGDGAGLDREAEGEGEDECV